MVKNFLKFIIFTLASTALILIDQYTKSLAFSKLYNKPPYVVIDNILEFVYSENRGAAFGILQGKYILFYIITFIILIVIFVTLYRLELTKHNIPYFIFLILIFSGAIGNFIDRAKNKSVVDFIYFKLINFPVFNFADILITIACILILISSFTIYNKE